MTLQRRLARQLARHEGFRQFPYPDSVRKKLTIAYGRNLDDKGITRVEGEVLLANDVEEFIERVTIRWPWTQALDEARVGVLVNMAFNLGTSGLAEFTKMFAALRGGDYERAAAEMLDSDWARQVGGRAVVLTQQMRTARWLETDEA